MKKIVYALAAGNTFVLKPSEETPISGALIADIFDEAGLPAGVLNVVPGVPAEVGDRLIADPRVKMITFTGFKPAPAAILRRKRASTSRNSPSRWVGRAR